MSKTPCHRFETPAERELRARAWCEHLSPVFTARLAPHLELSDGVAMTTYNFGEILIGTVAAPGQHLERDARMIARQGIDHVLLQFYTSGRSKVAVGARDYAVQPGQMVAFDLCQPVVVVAEAVSATNIVLPRKLLRDHLPTIENHHGRPLDYGSEPVRRLFHTYLSTLAASAEGIEPHQTRKLAEAAASLCGACFQPDEAAASATHQLVAIAIRQFIEAEMGSDAFGVDVIVARFGLSRATLYRLFDADGGVANYIRERRLLRAIRLLTQPGGRPRVSAVAYATGFSDEKTFSRAFRRRFGLLPRETGAAHIAPRANNENEAVLLSWMKSLAA